MLATPAIPPQPTASPPFTAFIAAPSPIPVTLCAQIQPGSAAVVMAAAAAATAVPEAPKAAPTPVAAVPEASSARDLPGNSGSSGSEECKIGIRRVTKYDFKSVVELFRVRRGPVISLIYLISVTRDM